MLSTRQPMRSCGCNTLFHQQGVRFPRFDLRLWEFWLLFKILKELRCFLTWPRPDDWARRLSRVSYRDFFLRFVFAAVHKCLFIQIYLHPFINLNSQIQNVFLYSHLFIWSYYYFFFNNFILVKTWLTKEAQKVFSALFDSSASVLKYIYIKYKHSWPFHNKH